MNGFDTVCNDGAMVEYDNRFDLAKCLPCGKLFEWGNLKSHLLRKHVEDEGEVDVMVAELRKAREISKEEGVVEIGSEYLSIAKKIVLQKKPLKALEGFEVKECYKCNGCGYMAGVLDTLRKHGAVCEGFVMGDVQKTLGQTFMNGKGGGYVEVRGEDDDEVLILYDKMNEGVNVEEVGQEEVDISCMDAYLAEMRFDVVLKNAKLSEEKAFEMCEWKEGGTGNWVYSVVESYMQKAFNFAMDNSLTRVQEVKGERLRLGVSQATLRRYANSVCRLVCFLLSVVEDVGDGYVDDGILEGIQRLESKQGRNEKLLHQVFSMVLLDEPERKLVLLPLFLACKSVIRGEDGKGYRYGVAAEVSPVLAALKYLCQVVVVWEVYVEDSGEKIAPVEKWKRVDVASDARSASGLNYIHACMKISNRIRGTESGHVRFVRCGKHDMCGFVDGLELSISSLGMAMKVEQKEVGDLLDGLLCGLVLDDEFWDGLRSLKDNLRSRSVGHWFGTNPANVKFCEKWQKLYLQAVRGRLFNGTLVKKAEGNEFLDSCQEIQKKLLLLLQVCSGGPARGSEAAVIQVRNKKEASRHLFIQNGQLFFIITYHKGRSMQEGVGKVIARFPDAVTSGLALIYLLIVRPLEALLVGEIAAESGSIGEHRDYLFVRKGVRQEQRTLTAWFSKGMKAAGLPYGMNQYRQYYGGAIKNFFSASEEMEDQVIPLHMHGQAGHTEGTAHRIYGVSNNDMRSVTALQLEGYRESSRKWARKLGMSVGVALGIGHVSEGKDTAKEGVVDAILTEEVVAVVDGGNAVHVDAKLLSERIADMERVMNRMEGMLKVVMLRTQGDSGDEKRRGVKRKLLPEYSAGEEGRGKEGITSILSNPTASSPDAIASLREFLGNGMANFRSVEQEEGVQMALRGKQDALIVLPTGGGKSLTFMLPAFVGKGTVCVVIVPLVALQEDIVRRCGERGVQAVRWGDRNVAGNRVVVVSAENVASVEYRVFMTGLCNKNLLHAIFIDEGHLIVTSKDYRPHMKYIEGNVRPQGVRCGMYVLTATAPQALEESIAKECGLKNWAVVRGLTSRGNMKYYVKDVFWNSLKIEVLKALKGMNELTERDTRYIVYGQLREFCEEMRCVTKMMFPDVSTFVYHAGVEDTKRRCTEKQWAAQDGGKKVMFATNAFGCGLDIGNVRAVIHAGVPSSLIDFIQESGRGGRDGGVCYSIVLNVKDAQRRSVEHRYGPTDKLIQNSDECRRIGIDEFADGVRHQTSCKDRGMEECDVCEKEPHKEVLGDEGSSRIPGGGENGADTPGTKRSVKRRKESSGITEKMGVRQMNKVETTEDRKTGNEDLIDPVEHMASAEEVQEIADKLKGICETCSVKAGEEVRHRSERTCPNQHGRCLSCCGSGHDACDCPIRRSKEKGCFRCGISEYRGVRIHIGDTYGKRECPLRTLVGLCVTSWDQVATRQRIIEEFGLSETTTGEKFLRWVIGKEEMKGMEGKNGLGVLIRWLFTEVIHGGN